MTDKIRSLVGSNNAENRAISPVIGVILMVAIVVVLSAVIGTFVLGLGQGLTGSQSPEAQFSFDYDTSTDEVTVTHSTGATIPNDRVEVVNGASNTTFGSDPVQAGSEATISANPGETVKVIWTSETQEKSDTLQSYTVPQNA